jgi:hypothetical protein
VAPDVGVSSVWNLLRVSLLETRNFEVSSGFLEKLCTRGVSLKMAQESSCIALRVGSTVSLQYVFTFAVTLMQYVLQPTVWAIKPAIAVTS